MRCSTALSLATILFLFYVVEWSVGVPIPSDGNYNSTLEEEESGDEDYLVIGDMIIRRDPSRAGLVDAAWPDGVVPFTFAYTIAPNQKPMINQAMKDLSAISCIKFRPATRDDTYNIEFKNDPMTQGCSSYVGWQNRKNQPVQLSSMCSKGNAIHEILHALGFFHEQTRNDRDNYVQIKFENIQPGFENNFKKDSELYANAETDYFGVAYNYDSIMHYGKNYFSKNGQDTIVVKENPEGEPEGKPENLGQRDFISKGDIAMLRQKYGCGPMDENENEIPDTATENGEDGEGSTGAATTKPTTKSPMCQINPGLPMCKQ